MTPHYIEKQKQIIADIFSAKKKKENKCRQTIANRYNPN